MKFKDFVTDGKSVCEPEEKEEEDRGCDEALLS